jgi:DNA modification methylase
VIAVGSGTTLWVAERFGRDSIGIEINPKYCELVKKRMSNFQQTIFQGVTL